MSGRFWAIIGVIVAIFVGFLVFGNNGDKKSSSSNAPSVSSHLKGKLDSNVKLVEYGDFQCTVCGGYYPVMRQVFAAYQGKISFQFRNLPITQLHNNAFAAARAAEAASLQNKFWEMHDLLYENQSAWSASNTPLDYFKQYAKQLGLDSKKFEKDFASSDVNRVINGDVSAFKETKNDVATPTFFLNGQKLDLRELVDETGKPVAEKISAKLDEALAPKPAQQ
jgi:protein-disulfide isomerase